MTFVSDVAAQVAELNLPQEAIDFESHSPITAYVGVTNPDSDCQLRRIGVGLDEPGEVYVEIEIAGLRAPINGYWWKSELPREDQVGFGFKWIDGFLNGHLLHVKITPGFGHLILDVRDPALMSVAQTKGFPSVDLVRYDAMRMPEQ